MVEGTLRPRKEPEGSRMIPTTKEEPEVMNRK